MTIKEKKRKLSEILGINLFEPRFKEIDIVLGDDDTEAEKAAAAEFETENGNTLAENESEETSIAEKTESAEEESEAEDETEKGSDTENSDEEAAATESETERKTEETEESSESESETSETTEEEHKTETEETVQSGTGDDELFDAKLEAKLLRAGIREDRLDAAKKLFKADHTLTDIEKVEKWVKEYPEWTQQKTKEQAKGFGMGVGENDNSETAEEKRLRELGII